MLNTPEEFKTTLLFSVVYMGLSPGFFKGKGITFDDFTLILSIISLVNPFKIGKQEKRKHTVTMVTNAPHKTP